MRANLHFTLDESQSSLYNQSHEERLASALQLYFNIKVNLAISIGTPTIETPAMIKQRLHDERQQQAQEAFMQDDHVQTILTHFNGKVLNYTIKPVDH